MKTSSAKSKGRELQKYAAKTITETCDLEEGDLVSRPMGSGGCDLMASPKAKRNFPFSVECKNTRTFPSIAALNQSKANAVKNTLPAAVWKPPGKGMDQSIIYFNFKEFTEFWAEKMGIPDIKSDNIDKEQMYYLSKLPKYIINDDDLGRQ